MEKPGYEFRLETMRVSPNQLQRCCGTRKNGDGWACWPVRLHTKDSISNAWLMQSKRFTKTQQQRTDLNRKSRHFISSIFAAKLYFIDLRCQNKVTFSETIDLVCPDCNFGTAPAKTNVGMMALLLSYVAYLINKSQRLA